MWSRKKEGIIFVLSAPSGAGKTTVMKELLKDKSLKLKYSISCTTREPRKGEKNGRDYFFLKESEFLEKVKNNEFLEYAKVYGHYYGTDRKTVMEIVKKGFNVLIDVDTKGAYKLMKTKGFKANYIFILPPSIRELKKRLARRKTESKRDLEKRIKEASKEIKRAAKYDYCVVNKNVNEAVSDLKAIIKASFLKREMYIWKEKK